MPKVSVIPAIRQAGRAEDHPPSEATRRAGTARAAVADGLSLPTKPTDSTSLACTCQLLLWGESDSAGCAVHADTWYDANNCCTAGESGTDADNDGAAAESAADRRERRYGLRERLARCTVHEAFKRRIDVCGDPIGGTVVIRSRDGTAYPSGVSTCGSMFCPVCGPKIRGRRAEDFGAAVTAWLEQDDEHDAWLVTLNARNAVDLSFDQAVNRALKGWQRLRNRRAWRQLAERYGLHYIRGLDVTHGVNGWNVHLHIVLATVSGEPAQVLADLYLILRRLWPAVMASLGFDADPRVAVDIRPVDAATAAGAGEYLAKATAWGVGDEIARADLKLGRQAGRTYEQIVGDYDESRRAADLALIREYHDGLWGRRQFSWSQGFRELLHLAPEQTDEELAGEDTQEPAVDEHDVVGIDGRTYWVMLRRRQVGALLDCAEQGGLERVRAYVVDTLGFGSESVRAPGWDGMFAGGP
jgi:Replication protein